MSARALVTGRIHRKPAVCKRQATFFGMKGEEKAGYFLLGADISSVLAPQVLGRNCEIRPGFVLRLDEDMVKNFSLLCWHLTESLFFH